MTTCKSAPHGSNSHDHVCLCSGCNPQPPDEEQVEVEPVQRWYCENEECGVCINDERYQCAGCGGWFCPSCSSNFRGSEFRVCMACLLVWGNLCPTGCATRLLLGVNRLLNHCRSPHAKKRWWIRLSC